MSGYMLDTNIFNRLVDMEIDILQVVPPDAVLFVIHIQLDEINETPNGSGRKDELTKSFQLIDPVKVSTSLAIWGDSYWDDAEFADEKTVKMYDDIIKLLPKRLKKPFNPSRDARIAVTAIKKNLILVTADRNLFEALKKLGHEKDVIFFEETLTAGKEVA